MKKYNGVFLLCFIFVFLLGIRHISDTPYTRPSHKVLFYDGLLFNKGIAESAKENEQFPYHVRGGIIPHHVFPSFMIAEFFNKLTRQNPGTIILVGPNHYERGNFPVLTSMYGWETPFGTIVPNSEKIKKIVSTDIVQVDEAVLPNDHAVSAIMPFIRYFLPDTRVVPLLLSGRMSEDDTKILSQTLQTIMDENTIVVAAVDFSHYLPSKQAVENDVLTLNVIKTYDFRQLYSMNNDYLDSPPSIGLLLMMMKVNGWNTMDLLHNTNSGLLQNDEYSQTTSYFSISYH